MIKHISVVLHFEALDYCSIVSQFAKMMLSSNVVARRAAIAPAGRKATPALPKRSLVIRKFKEGDQVDTSGQGQNVSHSLL